MARPRKTGKQRYKDGSIVKAQREPIETEGDVLSVVRWQRERMGATARNYRDQRFDDPLGWMRLWAVEGNDASLGLSEQQYQALALYIKRRSLSRRAEGFGPEHIKAMNIGAVGGQSLSVPPSDDLVMRLRKAHSNDNAALMEYAGAGVDFVGLLEDLALGKWHAGYWRGQLGNVRMAGNVLARLYRVQDYEGGRNGEFARL